MNNPTEISGQKDPKLNTPKTWYDPNKKADLLALAAKVSGPRGTVVAKPRLDPVVANLILPLRQWTDDPLVEEVIVNRPHEANIRHRKLGRLVAHDLDWLTADYVISLLTTIANTSGQKFHKFDMPILKAPLDGHRLTAIVGSNCAYHKGEINNIAFCIRCLGGENPFQLSQFVSTKDQTDVNTAANERYSEDPIEDLIRTVKLKKMVLVSGGTSTGKTTFMQRLIEHIPREDRIVTFEDVPEIELPDHPDHVHLLASGTTGSNDITMTHITDLVKRFTPDVIIGGEISSKTVEAAMSLLNSGHGNFITTIHANSPELAIKAFWQNLVLAKVNMPFNVIRDILSSSISRIVQIGRSDQQRFIKTVEIPGLVEKVFEDPNAITDSSEEK